AWIMARPVRGVYLWVLVVPLVVDLQRGAFVPVLRPNEWMALGLIGLVALYWTWPRADRAVQLGPLTAIDSAFGVLAILGVIVPLAVLLYRDTLPSLDDVFELLSLPKLYISYRLFLALIPNDREMVRVARLMLVASVAVAIIGIMQVTRLFGM